MKDMEKTEKLNGISIKVQKYRNESRRAAVNTGMFYILGAATPIIPFLFLPVLYALILSVILVAFSQ